MAPLSPETPERAQTLWQIPTGVSPTVTRGISAPIAHIGPNQITNQAKTNRSQARCATSAKLNGRTRTANSLTQKHVAIHAKLVSRGAAHIDFNEE